MRTRVLLASLALVAVVVVGSSAPAFAASTAAKAPAAATVASASKPDKDTQECKKILDEGKSVDTCQQAPSPILPPMNELVWGIISFVAVMFLLWKFAWPGIKTGMEGRTQKIAKDLEEAEAQRTGAEGILAEYKAQLADAKTESARIIDEARQSADAMRKDLEARAAADIAELRTRAASDIEAAKVQAIADLRAEVTELAIGAAESVVGHSLDQATSTALVEQYIDQVGASR